MCRRPLSCGPSLALLHTCTWSLPVPQTKAKRVHSEDRSPPGPTHGREGELHPVLGSSPPTRETGVRTDDNKVAGYWEQAEARPVLHSFWGEASVQAESASVQGSTRATKQVQRQLKSKRGFNLAKDTHATRAIREWRWRVTKFHGG